MTDHERIEELLAGYVLRSLGGVDASEADGLLTEHVPGCAECRDTLAAFQSVAAEISLDADPILPPTTLLPRLHREMEPRERRSRPLAALAVAASVVAVVGLAGTFLQGQAASAARTRGDALRNIFSFTRDNDAQMTSVGPATQVAAPGVDEFYLYGDSVPAPPSGSVYGVWLVTAGRARYLGSFAPRSDGWVYLHVETGGAAFDKILITVEPEGVSPSAPGTVEWYADS